jgi:hypothetical protein
VTGSLAAQGLLKAPRNVSLRSSPTRRTKETLIEYTFERSSGSSLPRAATKNAMSLALGTEGPFLLQGGWSHPISPSGFGGICFEHGGAKCLTRTFSPRPKRQLTSGTRPQRSRSGDHRRGGQLTSKDAATSATDLQIWWSGPTAALPFKGELRKARSATSRSVERLDG